MTERFKALKEGDEFNFSLNSNPKCPHCGAEYDVAEAGYWEIYSGDGDEHEIDCPSCDDKYTVTTNVSYSFSTDYQPELE